MGVKSCLQNLGLDVRVYTLQAEEVIGKIDADYMFKPVTGCLGDPMIGSLMLFLVVAQSTQHQVSILVSRQGVLNCSSYPGKG